MNISFETANINQILQKTNDKYDKRQILSTGMFMCEIILCMHDCGIFNKYVHGIIKATKIYSFKTNQL